MSRRSLLWLSTLVLVLSLVAGCAAPAAPAPQAPAPAATTATEPTKAPELIAPEPTKAPEPAATAVPEPVTEPVSQTLRLATTTSTADSGLLDFILPDFEQKFGAKVDVVAVGTGQALEIGSKGDADVVLVHSRKGEDQFVADGHAKERFDVMYNDYIIVGPADDPAKIAGMATGKEAFQAIADAEAVFVSRGDKSGTNTKELSIWASIPITPTAELGWYNSIGQGMGDTLLFANEQQGYTLTDRGTYLSMRDKLPDLAVLVGGANLTENKDKALLNPYGVLAVDPGAHPGVNAELATQFVEWLLSLDTQKVIEGYGVEEFGQPLFYPSSEEYKATRDVTIKIGDKSQTFALADLQALPQTDLKGYEATGHKKGPLGANDWTGVSLKDLMLLVDPTIADPANDGKFIVATASDGWKSTLRWNQLFGEPRGGQALADSYGCSECHGYMGEGTAPKGKTPTPALAGKGFTAAMLGAIVREGHAGINPYTPEQLPDTDLEELAAWFADPTAPISDTAYTVPPEQIGALLALVRNGKEMNGRDGLIQLIMPMDKYTSRYAHWVQTVEVVEPAQ